MPGHEALQQTFKRTVGDYLGATFFGTSGRPAGPMAAGLTGATTYALIPLIQQILAPNSRGLMILSLWGVAYFGIVVALTRSTAQIVHEIVEMLVLPSISPKLAQSIRDQIDRRLTRPKVIAGSTTVATISILISCWILRAQPEHRALVIWAIGFFALYFTAAEVTITAQFYTCFSHSLLEDPAALFEIDPAASPVISAMSRLARRILYYWLGVFTLVVSLLSVPEIMHRISPHEPVDDIQIFVKTVVIVAGFFSFAFGSLVYLKFENDLRIAIEQVRLSTLSGLQAQYRELFEKPTPLSDDEKAKLEGIKSAADRLTSPEYSTTSLHRLGTTALALIPPAVAIAVALIKSKGE